MIAAAGLLALELTALAAPWNQWRYQRRIDTPPRTATVSIVLPPSLYSQAQPNLADLRIISENEQIPFAIVTVPPSPDVHWVDARIEDTGYVRTFYSQAVGDVGRAASPFETIEIETPERTFATVATVEASDDRKVWRIIKTRAPLYDYAADGLDTNLRIHVPPTSSEFVRVRIAAHEPFVIAGIRVAETLVEPAPLTRYAVGVEHVPSSDPKTSVYVLSGVTQVPFERVDVYSSTSRYSREARLQFDDGAGWQNFASARLTYAPDRDERSFTFDEVQLRKWRLVIENGDDAPLDGIRVYAFGAPRRIVFDARNGRSYRLMYGNRSANMPSYDYADTHGRFLYSAPNVALERAWLNAAYAPATKPQPWSEKHRWILWLALAVAAFSSGGLALRALRSDE